MINRALISAVTIAFTIPTALKAEVVKDNYTWISETQDIQAEGLIWNDRLGDGADRYKTGGMTQSWLFPESIFSDEQWIEGHGSALELRGRGFIATPENTNRPAANDRPFAQFVGVGAFLRTFGREERINQSMTSSAEHRIGLEFGWQGDPLPLFDLQDALHRKSIGRTAANTLDSEVLLNLEAEAAYRLHVDLDPLDLEVVPFVQGAAGMRENSIRFGADMITGSSLRARTWNREPATGAMIVGGSAPRNGFNWATWVGADIGYIAQDAFLDGGFDGSGPSTPREEVVGRLRAGLMMEYQNFAVSYSLAWLSPEFESQPEGQLIGGFQIKYRF